MKLFSYSFRLVITLCVVVISVFCATARADRQMELLGRGVVAIQSDDGDVFVSWRLLGTDPDDIAFNLYPILHQRYKRARILTLARA